MKSYLVKREHIGDKLYRSGDRRRADPALVGHLVKSGVLVEGEAGDNPENKSEQPPQNKAAQKVQDKADQ